MHSPFCPTLRAYLLKSSIDMRCSFYLFRCLGNHCNEGWVVCVAPILPWRTSQWFLLLILFHDFPSQIKHDTFMQGWTLHFWTSSPEPWQCCPGGAGIIRFLRRFFVPPVPQVWEHDPHSDQGPHWHFIWSNLISSITSLMELISLLIFEVIFISILEIQLAITIERDIVRNENSSSKIKLPKIIGFFHFMKKQGDFFFEISTLLFSFVVKLWTSTFIAT